MKKIKISVLGLLLIAASGLAGCEYYAADQIREVQAAPAQKAEKPADEAKVEGSDAVIVPQESDNSWRIEKEALEKRIAELAKAVEDAKIPVKPATPPAATPSPTPPPPAPQAPLPPTVIPPRPAFKNPDIYSKFGGLEAVAKSPSNEPVWSLNDSALFYGELPESTAMVPADPNTIQEREALCSAQEVLGGFNLGRRPGWEQDVKDNPTQHGFTTIEIGCKKISEIGTKTDRDVGVTAGNVLTGITTNACWLMPWGGVCSIRAFADPISKEGMIDYAKYSDSEITHRWTSEEIVSGQYNYYAANNFHCPKDSVLVGLKIREQTFSATAEKQILSLAGICAPVVKGL